MNPIEQVAELQRRMRAKGHDKAEAFMIVYPTYVHLSLRVDGTKTHGIERAFVSADGASDHFFASCPTVEASVAAAAFAVVGMREALARGYGRELGAPVQAAAE